MNYVFACGSRLKSWRKAFSKIRHDVSRRKAVDELIALGSRMNEVVSVREEVTAKRVAKLKQPDAELAPALPVPVLDSKPLPPPVIEVPAPAADLRVDFSGVIEGKNLAKAVHVGAEIELTLRGYCPNPRLLMATDPEGRSVSVWRGMRGWRFPAKALCRLGEGGIYTPI